MLNVNVAYKQACESNERSSYVVAKYGNYNKKAKSEIATTGSNSSQPFNNSFKVFNEIKETNYNYITCEPNRVVLNGEFYFLNNKSVASGKENVAYWSAEMSNENCTFSTNPIFSFQFKTPIEFTELTLYFQEVCEEFVVKYKLEDTILVTRQITNNLTKIVVTNGATTRAMVTYDEIEIEFIKTKEPYRYIKLNEIDFGTTEKFTNNQIADLHIIDELSIDSSELSSNFLTLSIKNLDGEYSILNPNNKLKYLQEKQEISVYHYLKVGNRFQETMLGTFLIKKITPRKQTVEIEAYDNIYFMNEMYYGGKFYNNTPIKDVLKDLFDYFNYTNYVIDDETENIKLYGYVPNVEWREALRQICEAGCCVVSKTRDGSLYIYTTHDDPISKKFTPNLIFDEEPEKNMYNNIIDVEINSFIVPTDNVDIYSNTLQAGTHTIIYSKLPVLETSVAKKEENNKYEIIQSYATSCVVEVKEETKIELIGKHYENTKTVVRKLKEGTTSEGEDYAISKVENTLITQENAEKVANWKLNRNEIKFNFNTLVVPYVEVGDSCEYVTKYGNYKFVPTRIEFDNTLLQNIEGE